MYFSKQPSTPESPLVDFHRLEEVCMADTDAMHELAEFFFSQADQEMADLDRALKAESVAEVRRLAHRLLGASAGCGMACMVTPFTELEQQAGQGILTDGRELFAHIAGLLEQCRLEVARWRLSIQNESL